MMDSEVMILLKHRRKCLSRIAIQKNQALILSICAHFFVSILLLDGYEVEYDGSNGYPSARWIILSHKQRT